MSRFETLLLTLFLRLTSNGKDTGNGWNCLKIRLREDIISYMCSLSLNLDHLAIHLQPAIFLVRFFDTTGLYHHFVSNELHTPARSFVYTLYTKIVLKSRITSEFSNEGKSLFLV